MPRLQLQPYRGANLVSLLVWQRHQPEKRAWSASSLLWTNLLEAQVDMSTPVLPRMPRRAVSTLYVNGADSGMLLREA